ncbi:MAG TPA: hypothetical protein VG407_18190 [Caulobacteraceae bacterium]|jgi:hypothetical protein|nr:hypothetical protein [Caulobacteraceae bacterium]
MKHLILGAVSTAALLLAGSAFAQNVTIINQQGSNNSASADQSAGANELTQINQISSSNIATVTQGGFNDETFVDQDTDGTYTASSATVTQIGQNGTFQIAQHGFNSAVATQGASSIGETGYITQTGYNPGTGAFLEQNGFGNNGWIMQTGNFNVSIVTQIGSGGAYTSPVAEDVIPGTLNAGDFGVRQGGGSQQVGNYNTSVINQEGDNSVAVNEATGNGNFQWITQNGLANQATGFFLTIGSNNSDSLTQVSGAAYSGAAQKSEGGNITVYQDGASTALIGQGTHVDSIGIPFNDGPDTQGASAYVSQTGDGHFANIIQFGDYTTADITQVSGGANVGDEADINQGGQGDLGTISQGGSGDFSHILQSGVSDTAYSTQAAGTDTEGSDIQQSGAFDTASVNQAGQQETSQVFQQGDSNNAQVDQAGFGNTSVISQGGSSNYAYVSQHGANASSTVTQNGSGNSAFVHQ